MAPRTTICCTVGPACEDVAVLEALIEAGADVFRVNGAHADEAELATWVERVRAASEAAGRITGVMLDLPGTKFRVGEIAGPGRLALRPGDTLRMDALPGPSTGGRIPVRSVHFFADLPPGSPVMLGDGRERLVIRSSDAEGISLEVVDGGEVRTGMGVHFPGVALPTAVPTQRDRALLRAGIDAGVDMVAQSFVRNGDDMARLKQALVEMGQRAMPAIAKIERVEAVEALDRIVARADGLIVARGDLGVDAGVDRVPSFQRRILEAGRRAACPVIIATEMLDSMTRGARPTRAEASDVAGAVFEAADGVMLSGETAVGDHPALVARTMARILETAEADPTAPYAGSAVLSALDRKPGRPDQHVVRAAVDLARETGARAIVVFTREGRSAMRLSKERPRARIHAFAPSERVGRRLSLAWGVRTALLSGVRGTDEIVQAVQEHLRGSAGLTTGDRAVVVMGSAKDPAGATTLIKLATM